MLCGRVWGIDELVAKGRRFEGCCQRLVDDGLDEVVGPQCALGFLAELGRRDCLDGWLPVGLGGVQVPQKRARGQCSAQYLACNNHHKLQ